MRGPLRGRALFVLSVALLGWLLLLGRGAYLTLLQHDHYEVLAAQQQAKIDTIPGVRGPIYDRQGRVLACTMENASLAVRLGESPDARELIGQLRATGVCSDAVAERLLRTAGDRPGFQWVQRRWLTTDQVRVLEATGPGVILRPEMKRFYPEGPLSPQLLGLTCREGIGRSGLEAVYDGLLRGREGRVMRFQTGGGLSHNARPEKVIEEPDHGHGLVLTLDAHLQGIVKHRLREGMASSGATQGSVLLMDPATGEILALCQEPSFDPLHEGVHSVDQLKLRVLQDQYEPGSTFKIVTFAAAFEHGVVSPHDSVDCGNGVRPLTRGKIRDHRPFGTVTVAEAFTHSSNIGAGRIAEQVGWERLYETTQAMGFGLTTGLGWPGEAAGRVPHPFDDQWSERSLITIAYGQEIACTALQMAMATATIANDGLLMKPRIVRALLGPDGAVRQSTVPQVVRRAMTVETAQTMRHLLRAVVASGTGTAAEVAGFSPAGKTGTAQIYDAEAGAYTDDEHILSFSGFAPYDAPQVLCQVVLRCPGELHASEAAVPVFGAIIEDIAWMLTTTSHPVALAEPATDRISIPDVGGLDPLAARRMLHRLGLLPVLDGLGDRVIEMHPPAHRSVVRGTPIVLALAEEGTDGLLATPDVRGLSLRRAAAVLAEAGLQIGVHGAGWVARQEPAPGSEVAPGTLCTAWATGDASLARRDAVRREDVACETR